MTSAKLISAVETVLILLLLSSIALDDGPSCEARTGQDSALISGSVVAGDTFAQPFANRFIFGLSPVETGWEIVIREQGREENLARLTPPWHFVPNPRYIEGWHFRNIDNTAPNNGSVNAPGSVREFIFSPEVGRTIEYMGSATEDTVVARVAEFGRGRLEIVEYELTPPLEGERAALLWMKFEVCLVVREPDAATSRPRP